MNSVAMFFIAVGIQYPSGCCSVKYGDECHSQVVGQSKEARAELGQESSSLEDSEDDHTVDNKLQRA